nr:hypothetical protein [Tanacetum cinerariifolium]
YKGSKKSKTSETTSWSAACGFNLNDEVDESEEETQEQRRMGRGRAKKKASASSHEGSSFIDLVVDKFFNIKSATREKMKKQQDSYIWLKNRELDIQEATRREAVELKREKLAIQRQTLELAEKRKRDKDILFYNS